MNKLFYRFRKTQSIFEYKELEKQEIYFASSEELNDPMEGFKNLVFKGDKIVWRNLFRHYLLCLESIYRVYAVCGEKHLKFNIDSIPVFRTIDDIETPLSEESFKNIYLEVFEIYGGIIDKITTKTTIVSKEELTQFLYLFNPIALATIEKVYKEEKLITKLFKDCQEQKVKIKTILQEHGTEKMYEYLKSLQLDSESLNFLQNIGCKDSPNWLFIVNFPQNYLKAIEKLTYPKTYVACFTGEKAIRNSSVWGHYADSHKGVCLIFESDELEELSLSKKEVSYAGNSDTIENKSLKFKEIKYDEYYPEIDFFRSLGKVKTSKIETWLYSDEEKKLSEIHHEIFSNHGSRHTKFWNVFSDNNIVKTKDWEYENEYRLVLDDGMDENYRKYDFNSLKGLIFGINTTDEDKIKIFEIIQKKCVEHQRKDFEFYQAYHCNIEKNIQSKKLNIQLIKD